MGSSVALAQEAAAGQPPERTPDAAPSEAAPAPGEAAVPVETPTSPQAQAEGPPREGGALETVVRAEGTHGLPVVSEAQSIGVLTTQDLRRSDGLLLEESLNLLPGVRVESRTVSGGQRITIRGYGNSTNFNGMGYRAYLDGIPLTDAEGVTLLDDVDPSTLGRVEVIRGPASSLYGSGIGGVVKFSSLRPRASGTRLTQEVLGGSLGLLRTNTRVEHGTGNASLLLNYGHQRSDGYRVHSASAKDNVLLSGHLRASERQSLSVFGSFNRSNEQLSGQLTEEQFLGEQNVAEPAYLANDAFVGVDSVRFGIAHRYDMSTWVSNTSSVYATGTQLAQPFAAGRTDNLSVNLGARTEFALSFTPWGRALRGVVGADVQQTNAFKKSYALANGVLGAIRGDLQVTTLQSSPAFTEWDLQLPYELTATAGASVNLVRYHIRDRIPVSATHPSQSGIKEFSPVLTPRVALMKNFGPNRSVYAQVSQGYSPPGSGSVVIPQIAQVNADLRPERATNFEVGTKGIVLGERLSYEAALFDMRVTDKLTPQLVREDSGLSYNITTNAGRQTNRGLELAARYAVISDAKALLSSVQPFVSYTVSRFRYQDFKNNNNNDASTVDYTGNRVVGVPSNVLNAGVDFASRLGLYLNTSYQRTARVPLTFDNAHYADGYSLLNAKLGYRADLPKGFRIDAAAGSNNLLGSRYYTMAFLNANYAGPAAPNVYLPGPSKPTYFTNLTLSYTP